MANMLTDVGIIANLDRAIMDALAKELARMYADEEITRAQYLQYDLCHVSITIPPANPVIV